MLQEHASKMPVVFIGHGSPMNAIEDNPFTQSLSKLGNTLQSYKPTAIMVVSAHWLTHGTYVATTGSPKVLYDFYGFPDELYQVQYSAKGAPDLARATAEQGSVQLDDQWGLDHGAWAVLKHMFPAANIPVYQLSIDFDQSMEYHFDLARRLRSLREKGVLVVGSGNIVHNLEVFYRRYPQQCFDLGAEFDSTVKRRIEKRDFQSLVEYRKLGKAATFSVPTVDHYVPLLYCLGMADENEEIHFTYEEVIRSLSMRCFSIGCPKVK